MEVIDLSARHLQSPVCLLIGNYDGVHLGHRTIIERAKTLAREKGLATAVLSFDPHPLKVLAPQRAPLLLQTREQKRALLAHYGIDYYLVLPFDRALADQDPETFVAGLQERVAFVYLLVGFNFRFGRGRSGDTDTLAELGARHGFETLIQTAHEVDGEVVSSSRIRRLVAAGEMAEAARLLGRPYFLEGRVGAGDRIGKEMRTPTANVVVENELMPRFGVYASWTRFAGRWFRSITNLGVAPTTGRNDVRFETHLFDFQGDLYGRHLFVCLGAYLRPEQQFESLEALKNQIASDIAARLAMNDVTAPAFFLETT